MTTKTLELTEPEVRMLETAMGEFELGFVDGWEYSGYSKAQVKAYFRLREKVNDSPVPDINEVWEQK